MGKKALNLSIDEELIKFIKHKSIEDGASVSELVAEYIQAIKKNNGVIKAIRDINK